MSKNMDDFETKGRGERRERDMILAPNEYALISDETKGEINVYTGPNKTSLAGTDRPVKFNTRTKRFDPCALADAVMTSQTAPEGWYIILKNPAAGGKHPSGPGKLSTPDLEIGKKVNISGPTSFALWPGQMAKVVQGHNLRSNEYLLVRVYDEKGARENWSKAVIKAQADGAAVDPAEARRGGRRASLDIPSVDDLTMGKLFVIRGTDVSFYIPSTGIEVVPEKVGSEERYVREAVSLERLEYCLLLDQDGNKRYERGPAVVFPRSTERFVEAPIKSSPDKAKAKKFRAQELTPTSGIHVRVIADYVEADGTQRKAGDELFITGTEQPVYFPREEHAIIKYGEQDVHYGLAIPAGDARYVLDRTTGEISIVKGPQIFLADPRRQVIAQRALPLDLVQLLYPGNEEALAVNAARLGMDEQDIMGIGGANAAFLNNSYVRSAVENESYDAVRATVTPDTQRRVLIKSASKALPGDAFDRKAKFVAPQAVVLNTKYDGVVSTTIWAGYAMLLIRKSGERRVVQGPGTFMLEYDESPQVITLSSGKPKTTDKTIRTVFLQTKANMVSDIIDVETKDFCRLAVKLSYRLNFEGDPERWFNVENYVKFLCDHMRSRLRSAVQRLGVEEFYGNHTEILRNIVLGSASTGEKRPGFTFTENGMHIYDLEVLGLQLKDPEVERLLVDAQRGAIQNTLGLAAKQRELEFMERAETIKRRVVETAAETRRLEMELKADEAKRRLDLDLVVIDTNARTEMERIAKEREAADAKAANELAQAEAAAERNEVHLAMQSAETEQRLERMRAEQDIKLAEVKAQVEAVVEKAKALGPDIIAALQAFGDQALIERLAQAMGPMSIIGGESVVDIMKKLLSGTNLAKQLDAASNRTPSRG